MANTHRPIFNHAECLELLCRPRSVTGDPVTPGGLAEVNLFGPTPSGSPHLLWAHRNSWSRVEGAVHTHCTPVGPRVLGDGELGHGASAG